MLRSGITKRSPLRHSSRDHEVLVVLLRDEQAVDGALAIRLCVLTSLQRRSPETKEQAAFCATEAVLISLELSCLSLSSVLTF